MTIKLTDLQLVLLSSAAARPDGNVLPPPDSITRERSRIGKAIATLLKRSLVVEAVVAEATQAWRERDGSRIGVFITDAGRVAIGAAAHDIAQQETMNAAAVQPSPELGQAVRSTKSGHVLMLLRREQGATLAELIEATGWLPHSTRAALTGLRKKGHVIVRDKRSDATCYRTSEAA